MANKINFTKATLDAIVLPAPGQRATLYDAKITGLQLRVTSQGIKTFCVRRRTKGGDVERITLGRYPDMSIEQARKLSSRVNAEIEEGANPAAVKRAHKAEPTLNDLFEMYMKAHGELMKRPEKMRDLFRLYLSPLADKKAFQITYPMVDRWHKELPAVINRRREQERQRIQEVLSQKGRVGRGVKSTPVAGTRTANTALALLHAIYEKARNKRWWTGENPAHGVDRFKETSRDRFLQADELPRFFQALRDEPNPHGKLPTRGRQCRLLPASCSATIAPLPGRREMKGKCCRKRFGKAGVTARQPREDWVCRAPRCGKNSSNMILKASVDRFFAIGKAHVG